MDYFTRKKQNKRGKSQKPQSSFDPFNCFWDPVGGHDPQVGNRCGHLGQWVNVTDWGLLREAFEHRGQEKDSLILSYFQMCGDMFHVKHNCCWETTENTQLNILSELVFEAKKFYYSHKIR